MSLAEDFLGAYDASPMSDNSQIAATKQDVSLLMEEIGKLYEANQRWKEEIIETIEQKIDASVKIKRAF